MINPKLIYSNLRPEKVEWFSTAVTITKFAISASSLFKGTSSNGISKIQIQMLENISKQLDVIQDGIKQILNELEDVKQLIGEIPKKVVQELIKKQLQGNINSYDELIRKYGRYLGSKKQRKIFIKDEKQNILNLITDIRTNRNILINDSSYLNIPLISTALYMEYNLMRMVNESDESILTIIESYKNYFTKMLYTNESSLETYIKSVRSNRVALVKKANETHFFEKKVSDWGYGHWHIRMGFYRFYSTPQLDFERERVKDLTLLGLIKKDEITHKVNYEIKSRMPRWYAATYDNSLNGAGKKLTRNFENYSNFVNNVKKETTRRQDKIRLETMRLYSAVSCYHAGNRALSFCQIFV